MIRTTPYACAALMGALISLSASSGWALADETCEQKIASTTVTAAWNYGAVERAMNAAIKKRDTEKPKPTDSKQRTAWEDDRKEYMDREEERLGRDIGTGISLGDVVTVKGTGLELLFDRICAGRSVVLFLNEWPIADVTPLPPTNPADGKLHFKLVNKHRGTDTTPDTWLPILSKPGTDAIPVRVSVGFANGYPMKAAGAAPILNFTALPINWLAGWSAIFVAMLGAFFWLALNTNVLRDPAPAMPGGRGTYSLARSGGAFWFFVIIAAYLFIGMVTGDFSNSLNSTALTLLGIGAATVLGSAAIDAQKDNDKAKSDQNKAIADVTAQLSMTAGAPRDLKDEIGRLKKRIVDIPDEIKALQAANPSDPNILVKSNEKTDSEAKLPVEERKLNALLANLQSQLDKLNGKSEGFIIDVMSDANGISFHRFQVFVWTVVLGIIFIFAVYQNLAMPIFNATLLGMLGISAGTYLGLKLPEPTTPTVK